MQLNYVLAQVQDQSMKLNITPQLKQALYILQCSSDELMEYIEQQSVENPLLNIEWSSSYDFKRPAKSMMSASGHERLLNNICQDDETLETILLSQLRLSGISEETYRVSRYLAGNLNEAGYLVISLHEVCAVCNVQMEQTQTALNVLQSLEPAGVGAGSLKECMLLQIHRDPFAAQWAYPIVSQYLNELASGKLKWIAERLGISMEVLISSVEYIRSLNPRPGLLYGNHEQKFIQPDACVTKKQEAYRVTINEINLPKVSIDTNYSNVLFDNEYSHAHNYIRSNLHAAELLLSNLEKRKSTLQRVIESIIDEQRGFFDHGIAYLKPMNLKKVAMRLDLHESTISRATQNKYVRTPHGIFELKFFFASGVSTNVGTETSSESIKMKIKKWIDHEDKRLPLSDQSITNLLVNEGVNISRRTVMKYREELGLFSSRLRISS